MLPPSTECVTLALSQTVTALSERTVFMKNIKRIMAMAGVILVAGIWIATLVIALTGSHQDLLTAFIVLSVLVPVLIYAILLVARIVSGKPATDEIDQAIREGRMPDLKSGPDASSDEKH